MQWSIRRQNSGTCTWMTETEEQKPKERGLALNIWVYTIRQNHNLMSLIQLKRLLYTGTEGKTLQTN
jgi:hypothetical protein